MIPKSQLRSECPVACTLDVIGDRWTLLVIRDLFLGKRHFDEFLASREGIATNILTARLARLSKMKLVRRVKSEDDRRRCAYELTEVGLTLKPLLKEAARWGLKHFHDGAALPATAFSSKSVQPRKKAPDARPTAAASERVPAR
jgi:DNA-binding HxlR family transcriptional regulator